MAAALPPKLSIETAGSQTLRVSWANAAVGSSWNRAVSVAESSLWQPVIQIPAAENNQFSVLVNAAQGNQFFRLTLLPFTSIGETSPVDGETGVAVIRETIVHFTAPLASNAVVTTDIFMRLWRTQNIVAC